MVRMAQCIVGPPWTGTFFCRVIWELPRSFFNFHKSKLLAIRCLFFFCHQDGAWCREGVGLAIRQMWVQVLALGHPVWSGTNSLTSLCASRSPSFNEYNNTYFIRLLCELWKIQIKHVAQYLKVGIHYVLTIGTHCYSCDYVNFFLGKIMFS